MFRFLIRKRNNRKRKVEIVINNMEAVKPLKKNKRKETSLIEALDIDKFPFEPETVVSTADLLNKDTVTDRPPTAVSNDFNDNTYSLSNPTNSTAAIGQNQDDAGNEPILNSQNVPSCHSDLEVAADSSSVESNKSAKIDFFPSSTREPLSFWKNPEVTNPKLRITISNKKPKNFLIPMASFERQEIEKLTIAHEHLLKILQIFNRENIISGKSARHVEALKEILMKFQDLLKPLQIDTKTRRICFPYEKPAMKIKRIKVSRQLLLQASHIFDKLNKTIIKGQDASPSMEFLRDIIQFHFKDPLQSALTSKAFDLKYMKGVVAQSQGISLKNALRIEQEREEEEAASAELIKKPAEIKLRHPSSRRPSTSPKRVFRRLVMKPEIEEPRVMNSLNFTPEPRREHIPLETSWATLTQMIQADPLAVTHKESKLVCETVSSQNTCHQALEDSTGIDDEAEEENNENYIQPSNQLQNFTAEITFWLRRKKRQIRNVRKRIMALGRSNLN